MVLLSEDIQNELIYVEHTPKLLPWLKNTLNESMKEGYVDDDDNKYTIIYAIFGVLGLILYNAVVRNIKTIQDWLGDKIIYVDVIINLLLIGLIVYQFYYEWKKNGRTDYHNNLNKGKQLRLDVEQLDYDVAQPWDIVDIFEDYKQKHGAKAALDIFSGYTTQRKIGPRPEWDIWKYDENRKKPRREQDLWKNK
jgi:hypothetical protein